MQHPIRTGLAAGAVGTVALNVATYLDMAARGRPASSVPADAVGKLAEKGGVDLGDDEQVAGNRRSGLGALLGYVTGLGVGAVYGFARFGPLRAAPRPVAAVVLGLAAMAGSDVPIAALGVSDPREWPASAWASDVVPHLAYGVAVAYAFDAIAGD